MINTIKDSIVSEALSHIRKTEIQSAFLSQGVKKVDRMKRFVDGELKPTNRLILTLNRTEVTKVVKLTDWHHEFVDIFIPTSLRCKKCHKFVHTKKLRTTADVNSLSIEGAQSQDILLDNTMSN